MILGGFQLTQLVKSNMIEYDIWDLIFIYTKNWLLS